METPLLARFEYVTTARRDLVREAQGGLNMTWSILASPWVAPLEVVHVQLRLVRFARPW